MTLSYHLPAKSHYLLLVSAFFASCSVSRSFDPQFVGELLEPPLSLLDGKALIWTTAEEDEYQWERVWLTGGSYTLSLGQITREIALRSFSQLFAEGAEQASTLENVNRYEVIITPRLVAFDGSFTSSDEALGIIFTLGFMDTVRVAMTLHVEVLSTGGSLLYQNNYSSGPRIDRFIVGSNEYDKLSELTHTVITELLNEAAADVHAVLAQQEPHSTEQ